MYKHVIKKGQIGSLEIKNRLVMAPMDTMLTGERMIRYYEERAKGGIGLIVVEHCCVNKTNGKAGPIQLNTVDPENLLENSILVERIKRHGTKVFFQLNHAGRNALPTYQTSGETVAPSAVVNVYGLTPRALLKEEIKGIVNDFVESAKMAQKAGVDGVEVHCAHGYLLSNFISKHSNLRTDEYGGSLKNRTRIVKEVVEGIKEACGKSFPVVVRISAMDSNPEGNDLETQIEVAKLIQSYGVDAIDLSQGNTDGLAALSCEPTSFPEACRTDNIKKFKEVLSVPLIAVNHLKSLEKAEALVGEQILDFAAFGRGLIADPHIVSKSLAGNEDEVIKCLSCLHCLEEAGSGKNLSCAINPVSCREFDYPEVEINGQGRKVLIAGAGPAGMAAAIELKKRGFEPLVYEAKSQVGGAFRLGSVPPHKEKLLEYCQRQENLLDKMSVPIVYNTKLTKELVLKEKPYAVIYAAGGKSIMPKSISGIENAYSVEDILEKKVSFNNKNIVVVGSGMTGIETAEFLGQNNQVTVIEMAKEIAPDAYMLNKMDVMMRLYQMGANLRANTMLKEIKSDSVLVHNMESESDESISCDAVILSLGVMSNTDELDGIEEVCRVIRVGDSEQVGRVGSAVRTGFNAARFID